MTRQIILALSSFFMLLSMNANAQISTCDSILIELVNVQDSAIAACEMSYYRLKKNFDLLSESSRIQSEKFDNSIQAFEREIIAIREELETTKAIGQKQKRRFWFSGIAGFGAGVLATLLIQ